MTTPLDTRNALAMEMLVACDQSYVYGKSERVVERTRIGPLPDSSEASEAPLPYALPDAGFVVAAVIQAEGTGFKSVLDKHETRNEFIVAMAGTAGRRRLAASLTRKLSALYLFWSTVLMVL